MARSKGREGIEDQKAELIVGLRAVRDRILALASMLAEEKQAEIFLGHWSVRELLAHLAGWDETNLKAADEILNGKLPIFYDHFDKDWKTYNNKLVSQYIRGDFEELISLVRETHKNLLAKIEEIPAEELWKDRGIRASGWKVTIGRLLEVELSDEEEHYQQLKDYTKNHII